MSIIQGKGNALVQMRRLINRPNATMLGVVVSVDTVTTIIPGAPGTSSEYVESRYWRIFITANNGDAYTTLKEVQIISPTDTVLTSPSTVTGQSTFYDASPAYIANAAQLVDGDFNDETSVWTTADASAVPSWVSFDLGTVQAVKSVKIMPQSYALPSRAPKDFQIQTSPDGVTWTTVKTESDVTAWTAEAYLTVTLPTTAVADTYPSYRYWKVNITSNNGSAYTALQEVELIGEADTDVTTPSTPVTASSYYVPDDSSPLKAVDNVVVNAGYNAWISDGTTPSTWLVFDLGTATAIKAFNLMAQTWIDEMEARAPNSFTIQGSADGTTWTTVKTVTGATGWVFGVYKTFALDMVSSGGGGTGGTPDTTVTTTGAIAGVDIRGTVYTVSTGGFTLAVGDSVQVASGMVQKKLKGTLGVNTSNIITQTGG